MHVLNQVLRVLENIHFQNKKVLESNLLLKLPITYRKTAASTKNNANHKQMLLKYLLNERTERDCFKAVCYRLFLQVLNQPIMVWKLATAKCW